MAITIRRRAGGEHRKLPEYRKLLMVSFFVAASVAPFARAGTVYTAGGFEAPFNNGNLVGQVPGNPWLHAGGTSTATVQASVIQSGTQAVQVDRAANSDDRWAVLFSSYSVASPVLIDWDMRVQQTIGSPGTFGPFFGVEAYDNNGGSPLLIGSFGVDATTAEVLYQQAGTGFLLAPGPTVPFGGWNHYQLRLDFSTHVYSFYLNSALVGSQGFVDGLINNFSDAPIAAFAAAGDPASLALTGTAYFDNYIITDAAGVPEPATGLLFLIGIAALLFRRRRSTT